MSEIVSSTYYVLLSQLLFVPLFVIDEAQGFLIFGAAFILTWKFKINPILMIILAGIAGIALYW